MKVVAPGLVAEYKDYNGSQFCEEHIRCLEHLDPAAGMVVRSRADDEVAKYGSIRHATYDLLKMCAQALDAIAPNGMYFGRPNVNSNIVGFWPTDWIADSTPRNPKGVPNSVAIQLGMAKFA